MRNPLMQFIPSFRTGPTSSRLLLFSLLLLTGCQHAVTLMPTPEVLRDERFDIFTHNPNLEKTNKVNVFYATNRLPSDKPSEPGYAKSFDHTLRFGEVTLQIGSDEQNWEQLYAESTTAERKDTFEISLIQHREIGSLKESDAPERLPEDLKDFIAELNEAIDQSPLKTLTIYVHGANSSFYRATSQGAQYRYFTGQQAVVLVFAWPSAENILKYTTDVKNTKQTVPDFIRLLEIMAKYSNAKRINIIAYSAGGRLTGDALGQIGAHRENKNVERARKALRFGQLYLTSSDEPLYEFIDYLPGYIHLFEGITVTADPKDGVLGFAKFTDGQLRLGRPPEEGVDRDLTAEQQTWLTHAINSKAFTLINLQVNTIPGFEFTHGAWYENPWVSTDVIATLNLGLRLEQRGLAVYKGHSDRDVWYFPPDYLQKLKAFLLERRKATAR